MINCTVALIKPDGMQRHLMGPILNLAYSAGLYPVDMRLVRFDITMVEDFYSFHIGEDYFDQHATFMQSGTSLAVLLTHDEGYAVPAWRRTMKAIRDRWGTGLPRNVVHGSDSASSTAEEAHIIGLHRTRWGL